ncbi:branched-chain amino acid ABC transporter substrate-binding protein [Pseudothauera nasutitermitis]|uniref:Branched-chain amino acid ABC transporter substrate-binding protein n=1 Tax=Pseudothauera nasutitermitis TaxID=2565930 RepID=A0A4V3WBF4_9RHOO|nr:ABC transporter substrate-binding protein [Pseudothauera nasutitermitis]THF63039.1 branched-chain amino acid ABC transporter substrate-binding protein [Pseudothauera nasutitermitis]
MKSVTAALAGIVLLHAVCVHAEAPVTVGVSLSTSGPAAALGQAQRAVIDLLPGSIDGRAVRYVVLDDAADPLLATANFARLAGAERADVVIGSTTVPASRAMSVEAAARATPLIAPAAAEAPDGTRRWVFRTVQDDAQMATALVAHMLDAGVRTVGFIGFADAYGEGWRARFGAIAEARGLRVVADERYARLADEVDRQAGRLRTAGPDAVLIAGAGSPAMLPARALRAGGYGGALYFTPGVAQADFPQTCGAPCAGALAPAGPALVAEQLPAGHPARAGALVWRRAWEAAQGAAVAPPHAAHVWDAGVLLRAALPAALRQAEPGGAEFRSALREALENVREAAGAHGVFTLSANDHSGLDQRAQVMVRAVDGVWRLEP